MIYIACSFDENYLSHCATMLTSLFRNNPDQNFKVFIIYDSVRDCNMREFSETFEGSPKVCIDYCKIRTNPLKDAPVTHHITLATYYRILLPEIIPNDVDKLLYLDCDILIRKSIQALWEVDISNFAMAATLAAGMHNYSKELGLKTNRLYFNAGVMLINLKWWRKHNVLNKSKIILIEEKLRLKWWDQDVLNIILENKWLPISLKWNAQPYIFSDINDEVEEDIIKLYKENDYLAAINDPSIVHYAGGSKPWHFDSKLPFFNEYLTFLSKRNWKYVLFRFKRMICKYVNCGF